MPGPWEKYQGSEPKTNAEAGPWAKYSNDVVQAKPEGIDFSPKGAAQALLRGAAQGASLGFADEATAGVAGLKDYVAGKLGLRGDISLSDAYHTNRNAIRNADAMAESKNPGVFMGGQIGGALMTAFAPGTGALNAGRGAGVAEAVSKGAAQGALTGAGTAREITDVPAEALKGGAIGGAAGGAFNLGGKAFGYVKGKAGPMIARSFGGVEESNLQKYLANPERINAAGGMPELHVQDSIDDAVARVAKDAEGTAKNAAAHAEHIDNLYSAKQKDLIGATTPLTKAKEMSAALNAEKKVLGKMSEEADKALDNSGVVFRKQHLLQAIDKIGKGAGDAVGDEAYSALSKLQATRDRIAEQLPENIPASRLRAVLQQVRKDINFDQASGEFNDALNGMRKEFTSQMSGALKTAVPEYAQAMEQMAPRAENLQRMSQFFGDESSALSSLEMLRKGGAKAQLVEDALAQHATITGDQSLAQQLANLRQSHAILERMKAGEDLRPELFPKEWSRLQEAQAEAEMAKAIHDPIGRISPNRTQSVIKNQGGQNANVVDARALEKLGQAEGKNFSQMIDDKNVFDSFKKGQTSGSRMAVIGGTAGGALGFKVAGPQGAAVGASLGSSAGGLLDKYGPALTKKIIDTSFVIRKMANENDGFQQMGKYAAPLIAAASKGNKTLAATHEYLYATQPDYRDKFEQDNAMKRKLRRTGE